MKYYNNGGVADSGTTLGGSTQRGEESPLASYVGPYVTEMLGKGQALASTPYQAYMGPLTAGPSALQQQAFSGLGSLALPGATAAGSFTGAAYQPLTPEQIAAGETPQPYAGMTPLQFAEAGGLGADADPVAIQAAQQMRSQSPVQAYMNPYLQAALEPQYEQARRQTDIAQQALQSRYAKAGAYGGSRQGVAEAELQRGLLDRLADITGTGYQQAYDKAADLFGEERQYGLEALAAQRQAGAEQRAIEQAGIGADIGQFREERDYPYKQLQYMQSLLQNVPTETQTYSYFEPSGLGLLGAGLGDITDIYDLITGGTFGDGTDGGGADGGGTGGGGLPDGMTAETINAMYDLYDVGYITPEDFKEYLRTGQLPKG